jgi:uncharacterized protein (DUF433 family)
MKKEDLLNRITVNPEVMVGKPTIKGLRITVEQILKALAGGVTVEELIVEEEFNGGQVYLLSIALFHGESCLLR